MNIDRPGEDFFDTDLDQPDPAPCAAACQRDPRCKAWTFVKPGVQGEKARCWLKDAVIDPIPDECCDSGVKESR
jgi:Ca-activated chloride channel homolog